MALGLPKSALILILGYELPPSHMMPALHQCCTVTLVARRRKELATGVTTGAGGAHDALETGDDRRRRELSRRVTTAGGGRIIGGRRETVDADGREEYLVRRQGMMTGVIGGHDRGDKGKERATARIASS